MSEEFITKYKLIDCLERHIETGWTENKCPLPCQYSRYIKVIINILTKTAPMASNPQFMQLFKEVCGELEIDFNKYIKDDG